MRYINPRFTYLLTPLSYLPLPFPAREAAPVSDLEFWVVLQAPPAESGADSPS